MAGTARPLKLQNVAWIWAIVVGDALASIAILHPNVHEAQRASALALWRIAALSLAPAIVFLLTSLVPSETKAGLVFWRWHYPLPGHRAFSWYATRDARIDVHLLRRNVGEFPKGPREQNSLWYRLYKKVDGEVAVALAHRHYLLFRDIAVLSLLLAVAVPIVALWIGGTAATVGVVATLFVVQYGASALAARNNGVRLVCTVLALHSVKRRTF